MTRTPGIEPELSFDAVYAGVAARRLAYKSLLWQVPALSIAAQSFLLSIALAPETQRGPRTIACSLSLLSTFLSLELMTRHRQGEITDSQWLARHDLAISVSDANGDGFKSVRDQTDAHAGLFTPLSRVAAFPLWSCGISLFGVAALAILAATWLRPALLAG